MAFGDIVQTAVNDNDEADPITVSLGSAVTPGNILVLTSYTFDGAGTPNGTLLEAVERVHGTNGDALGIFYRFLQSGDGQTWTVDLASADQWAVIAREYEGPFESNPLDRTGSSEDVNNNNLTVTASAETTQADELVVAAWGLRVGEGTSGTVTAVDNAFASLLNEQNSVGFPWQLTVATAKKVLTATGTPTVDGTVSPDCDGLMAALATFKKAAEGGEETQPVGRQAHGIPQPRARSQSAMPPSTALASGLLTSAPPFFITLGAKRTN